MSDMPALHVRNVPEEVVGRLKQRAKRNGRSLNSEIVDLLETSVENEREPGWVAKRLAELHAEYPAQGEPVDVVELIHEGREERAREIERRVRGS